MLEIRKIVAIILLWPSLDGDEVSKAQHGCIDCLALMICAELQTPESPKDSSKNKIIIVGKEKSYSHGNEAMRYSVLTYVIQQLTHDRSESFHLKKLDDQNHMVRKLPDPGCDPEATVPLSFRLCMANVIISACQKITSSGKKTLAKRTLPVLIRSLEVIADSEVRAACIQVLFSAVYHLKSVIVPYSSNLFKLAVKALREGSDKEKMAGVKLMASLMASEDEVVESISDVLLEASSLLSSISLMSTSSTELRQLCEKLLICISSPLDKL